MVKEAGRKGAEFCFRGAERGGLVRALTVSARGGGAVGLVMGAEGGGSCRWCDPGGCAAWATLRQESGPLSILYLAAVAVGACGRIVIFAVAPARSTFFGLSTSAQTRT